MKFWLVCLVVVFGMTELYQWFQGLTLPVPFYGAAGLLLALLSNANQWMPSLREANNLPSELSAAWIEPTIEAGEMPSEKNQLEKIQSDELQLPPVLHSSQTPTLSEPQLPNLPVATPDSISFTIQKP